MSVAPVGALASWGRIYRYGLLANPSAASAELMARILDEMGSVDDLQASVAAD